MEKYKSYDKTPWAEKQAKAVFRGGNRPSMFYKTKEEADKHAKESGRSRLHFLSAENPDLFDVGVSGRWGGEMHQMKILSEADHHQFKYIVYAEGNCFWADRLNKQIFGPSAIIKQETPCGQFWEPLLKPFTHYIPTDFFFLDTTEKIKWAQEHDSEAQAIVKNANDFAANFLTQKAIKMYVEVLLIEYSKLLNTKKISQEKGSQDVTVR
ncbi:Glycosyltransferase family GT90 [Gracilaria domingensis]|nr:Glycosyltransferase family GT90 [Gracilaria domingensis]